MTETEFISPKFFELGFFDKIQKPMFLPFDKLGSLVFDKESINESFCYKLIEQNILNFLSNSTFGIVKIFVFDLSLKNNFSNLLHISNKTDIVKFVTNETKVEEYLKDLFDDARRIITDCLTNQYNNIEEYNKFENCKENYNILIFPNLSFIKNNRELEIINYLSQNSNIFGFKVILISEKLPENYKYNLNNELLNKIYSNGWIFKRVNNKLFKIENLNIHSINNVIEKYELSFNFWSYEKINQIISKISYNIENTKAKYKDYISVPIGLSKNGKDYINFTISPTSASYHSIIGGRSGTGKSTFLRNLITQIGLKYSSDYVRIYLLDYKRGIEAEVFKEHPNVECLLIDKTNTRFDIAIEVLNDFENEIEKRINLFSELGKKINKNILNLDKYNELSSEKLPYLILIIDEANKLFEQQLDIEIYNQISNKIVNIAQQGRSAGLFFILCATEFEAKVRNIDAILNQIQNKIAFFMNDANSILGYNSSHLVKKLKPFQFIFNNSNGNDEMNQFGTTINLSEDDVPKMIRQMNVNHKPTVKFNKRIIEINKNEKYSKQKNEDPFSNPLM